VWGNTEYCVNLSGEDLSRYSNKIELVGLTKCPYYHYPSKKVMSNNKHFSEFAPHHGGKAAGIDTVCNCNPMYRDLELEHFAVEEEIFVEARTAFQFTVVYEELVEEPHADGQVPAGSVPQRSLELRLVLLRRLKAVDTKPPQQAQV